jgi:hypothetical protein
MAHPTEAAVDPLNIDRTCEEFGRCLAGRSVNVVEFVGRLLAVVDEVGAVSCRLESADALRFGWPGGKSIVVPVDRAKAKLRGACANLAVRSQALIGGECRIYGGSGDVAAPVGNVPQQPVHRLFAEWANTMHDHQFSITRTSAGNGDPSSRLAALTTE